MKHFCHFWVNFQKLFNRNAGKKHVRETWSDDSSDEDDDEEDENIREDTQTAKSGQVVERFAESFAAEAPLHDPSDQTLEQNTGVDDALAFAVYLSKNNVLKVVKDAGILRSKQFKQLTYCNFEAVNIGGPALLKAELDKIFGKTGDVTRSEQLEDLVTKSYATMVNLIGIIQNQADQLKHLETAFVRQFQLVTRAVHDANTEIAGLKTQLATRGYNDYSIRGRGRGYNSTQRPGIQRQGVSMRGQGTQEHEPNTEAVDYESPWDESARIVNTFNSTSTFVGLANADQVINFPSPQQNITEGAAVRSDRIILSEGGDGGNATMDTNTGTHEADGVNANLTQHNSTEGAVRSDRIILSEGGDGGNATMDTNNGTHEADGVNQNLTQQNITEGAAVRSDRIIPSDGGGGHIANPSPAHGHDNANIDFKTKTRTCLHQFFSVLFPDLAEGRYFACTRKKNNKGQCAGKEGILFCYMLQRAGENRGKHFIVKSGDEMKMEEI
ncbi:hypothetical protein niasHT_006386 [Heterodera trifolii]|uniref:Uncharacterized protein n=1 Tax=Heterodera trifolii TaxID=157864 RepID=A0ABD2M517_9BILA